MGYIASSSTTTVTARLTPYGKKKILSSNNSDFVSYFSFGDSDANYQTNQLLNSGEVPSSSGDLNIYSGTSNGAFNDISIRNKLIYDSYGNLYKPVGYGSFDINEVQKYIGTKIISGNTLTQNKINRTDYTTDSLTNLFNTFGLPLKTNDIAKYTTTTNANGGYLDTCISGFSNQEILVISIPSNQLGEIIDGKTIKLDINSSGVTYNCYGSFLKNNTSNDTQDTNLKETSTLISPMIGDNIVLLFSDNIKKPNGDVSKSWSTGFGNAKPFTIGSKHLFNYITNTNQNYTADTSIGIAYLDKGFIVITDNTIVSNFNELLDVSATTVTYNSLSTEIMQSFVCDALVSEFRKSSNPTFTYGVNTPRITEIGLYDNLYNLIAIAKLNKPYELNSNYFRIEVKISL